MVSVLHPINSTAFKVSSKSWLSTHFSLASKVSRHTHSYHDLKKMTFLSSVPPKNMLLSESSYHDLCCPHFFQQASLHFSHHSHLLTFLVILGYFQLVFPNFPRPSIKPSLKSPSHSQVQFYIMIHIGTNFSY